MNAATPLTDGRRRRSEQSQTAVVDAVLDLFRAGVTRPAAPEIARRAGVSERTLFRLFDDLEALRAIAVERQLERLGPLAGPPEATGGQEQRVQAIVRRRLALYAEVAPVLRAAAAHVAESAVLLSALRRRRRELRAHVADQFAPELAALPAPERDELLHALDLALGLDSIEALCGARGLSLADAAGVLRRTVRALLADSTYDDTHSPRRSRP